MAQTSLLRKLPCEIREMIYDFALAVDPEDLPVLVVDEILCSLAKLQPSERAFIPDRVIYREIVKYNIEHSLARFETTFDQDPGSGFDVGHDCPSSGNVDLADARFEMVDSEVLDPASYSDHDYLCFGAISPFVLGALRNVQVDIPGYSVPGNGWSPGSVGLDHLSRGPKERKTGDLMPIFEATLKSLTKAPAIKSISICFLNSMVTCSSNPMMPMYFYFGNWDKAFLNVDWVHLAACLATPLTNFPQLKSFGFRGSVNDPQSLLNHKPVSQLSKASKNAHITEICVVCFEACEKMRSFEECFVEQPRLRCNSKYFSIVWSAEKGMKLLKTEGER